MISTSHRLVSNESGAVTLDGDIHRPRIWENVKTWEEKYKDFCGSVENQQFETQYPDMKISQQVFQEGVCICIRDPKMASCVDLIMSELEEFSIAIKLA